MGRNNDKRIAQKKAAYWSLCAMGLSFRPASLDNTRVSIDKVHRIVGWARVCSYQAQGSPLAVARQFYEHLKAIGEDRGWQAEYLAEIENNVKKQIA